jgi:hypothetical protein
VAAWRGIDEGEFISVRREVRSVPAPAARTGSWRSSAPWRRPSRRSWRRPEEILGPRRRGGLERRPGDRHACEARAGLCLAAGWQQRDASRRCADGRARHTGPPDADRATLLRKIAQSQRLIERSARTVAGHETEPCPLVHPLVGRLRCGEWLLFAGVHDMMHLEQLHDLAGRTQPEGPPA